MELQWDFRANRLQLHLLPQKVAYLRSSSCVIYTTKKQEIWPIFITLYHQRNRETGSVLPLWLSSKCKFSPATKRIQTSGPPPECLLLSYKHFAPQPSASIPHLENPSELRTAVLGILSHKGNTQAMVHERCSVSIRSLGLGQASSTSVPYFGDHWLVLGSPLLVRLEWILNCGTVYYFFLPLEVPKLSGLGWSFKEPSLHSGARDLT